MRWGDMRRSENIEDRGSGGFPMGGGGMRIGLGGIIIALIASVLFGVNPLDMLGGMEAPAPAPAPESRSAPPGYGPQARRRLSSGEPDEGNGRARRRRHRGRLAIAVQGARPVELSAADARDVLRQRLVRVRDGERRRGAVLLPERREGVPGHLVLQPARAPFRRAGRLRAGVRRRARDRPSRAERARNDEAIRRAGVADGRAPAQPAAGAPRAAGGLLRRAYGATSRSVATCSSRATSRKGCAPRRPSATTRS